MLELAQTMLHKAVLHILPAKSTRGESFTNLVLGILHNEVIQISGLDIPLKEFSADGVYASEDSTHHLRIVRVPSPKEHPYPIYWAMRLTSRDPVLRHRFHTLHLGLQQTSDFEITLYIANMCSDDLGGRLIAARPIARKFSPLVSLLLAHPDLRCVTGNHVLLNRAIMLTNESMEFVLDMLLDADRTLPVLLVTCPDLVDPEILQSYLQGNAIVCFTDDPQTIFCLNENLPENSLANMDSIHIYLPFSSRNLLPVRSARAISLNDIYRLSPQGIYNLCYQSYCVYPRKSERDAFVTVDLCLNINQRRNVLSLRDELNNARCRIHTLEKELEACREDKDKLAHDHSALQEHVKNSDAQEYEELLEESIKELDNIKDVLRLLTSQLYNISEIPEPLPQYDGPLNDFLTALHYRLTCQK